VNQAIGRVIRHRNDWGAVLLCDDRFGHPGNRSQLPIWIRDFVKVHSNFGEVQGALTRFVRHRNALQPLEPKKEKPATAISMTKQEVKPGHLGLLEVASQKLSLRVKASGGLVSSETQVDSQAMFMGLKRRREESGHRPSLLKTLQKSHFASKFRDLMYFALFGCRFKF
jgi:hypothetical protein